MSLAVFVALLSPELIPHHTRLYAWFLLWTILALFNTTPTKLSNGFKSSSEIPNCVFLHIKDYCNTRNACVRTEYSLGLITLTFCQTRQHKSNEFLNAQTILMRFNSKIKLKLCFQPNSTHLVFWLDQKTKIRDFSTCAPWTHTSVLTRIIFVVNDFVTLQYHAHKIMGSVL